MHSLEPFQLYWGRWTECFISQLVSIYKLLKASIVHHTFHSLLAIDSQRFLLRWKHTVNNKFDGTIPSELAKIQALQYIQLGMYST